MTKSIKILVIAIVIIIIFVFIVVYLFDTFRKPEVITDKTEYNLEDVLKVKIKNNFTKNNICFSSCHPYYIERQNDERWQTYPYLDCEYSNLVNKCIDPGQIKAFEFTLPSSIDEEIHRLAIPVCIGCGIKQPFQEHKIFYSNEFIIK